MALLLKIDPAQKAGDEVWCEITTKDHHADSQESIVDHTDSREDRELRARVKGVGFEL